MAMVFVASCSSDGRCSQQCGFQLRLAPCGKAPHSRAEDAGRLGCLPPPLGLPGEVDSLDINMFQAEDLLLKPDLEDLIQRSDSVGSCC